MLLFGRPWVPPGPVLGGGAASPAGSLERGRPGQPWPEVVGRGAKWPQLGPAHLAMPPLSVNSRAGASQLAPRMLPGSGRLPGGHTCWTRGPGSRGQAAVSPARESRPQGSPGSRSPSCPHCSWAVPEGQAGSHMPSPRGPSLWWVGRGGAVCVWVAQDEKTSRPEKAGPLLQSASRALPRHRAGAGRLPRGTSHVTQEPLSPRRWAGRETPGAGGQKLGWPRPLLTR